MSLIEFLRGKVRILLEMQIPNIKSLKVSFAAFIRTIVFKMPLIMKQSIPMNNK